MSEAEYKGRKVKLNKIMQGDKKKFKVYVKNQKGNVVGVAVENEPAPTDFIIDCQVTTVFKKVAPRIVGVVDGVDVAFSCTGRFGQADGDVGVKRGTREESEQGSVLV